MAAKLEKTRHPGIYRRGSRYVVVWSYRGTQHKEAFRTLNEAKEAKGRRDAGERRPTSRLTVAAYYERWIESYGGRTSRGLEDSTRDGYRRLLEARAIPTLGGLRLRDLSPLDVRDWMHKLGNEGLSPNSIRKARAALSAMLSSARDDGLVPTNAALGVRYVPPEGVQRRHPAKVQRKLTVADVEAIFDALDPEWRTFFELLAHSGLRISEAFGLQWRHVHLGDDPSLAIREQVYRGKRKKLKTTGSERTIPLSPGMAKKLTHLCGGAGPDDPVFASQRGGPLDYGNVYHRVLQPALRDAGLDGQGVGFHAFRKALGSILIQRAGKHPRQVQRWLGHARLSTTMDVYQHDLDEGLGSADALDGILGGKGVATGWQEDSREQPKTLGGKSALESRNADQPQASVTG